MTEIATEHTHEVHNGKRRMTIDELALTQPGMDRLHAELGPRMHRLAFAARAQNWPLATYYLRSVIKQLKLSATVRPKYAASMDRYLATDVPAVRAAVEEGDLAAFEVAYARMVDGGNEAHVEFDKAFLVWKCPVEPPHDLVMEP